jgi:hypothetical protein
VLLKKHGITYIYNKSDLQWGDQLRRMVLVLAILCNVIICFCGQAEDFPAKASDTQTQQKAGNFTILIQDSGANISAMNLTLAPSITYGSGQAVRFSAPKPDWKLESVLIMATDGWNSSSEHKPDSTPFAVDIRDSNLKLLYHFADSQLPYFTDPSGVRLANIEVPSMAMNGDFFVCFYGYRSIAIAAELENATSASYTYDKLEGKLYPGVVSIGENQTAPVNWIIRIAGR